MEGSRDIRNWHYTSTGSADSVGATLDEPGYYPLDDEQGIAESVVAPGDYVENHPVVRREGLVDYAIRRAVLDWDAGRDLHELEALVSCEYETHYNINDRDKIVFSYLDKVGKLARNFFDKVFAEMTDLFKDTKISTFGVDWSAIVRDIEEFGLSERQRNLVLTLISHMRADDEKLRAELQRFIESGDILKLLSFTGAKKIPDRADMWSVSLPAAVGIVLSEDAFVASYPGSTAQGIFSSSVHSREMVNDHLFVVKGDHDVLSTLKHEYQHLLNARYFETNETTLSTDPARAQLQRELKEFTMTQDKLLEELKLCDQDEYTEIERNMLQIKRQIIKKQKELRHSIEESSDYLSKAADTIFRQMRDELSAYAIGGQYVFVDRLLLKGQQPLSDRMHDVVELSDRTKLQEGWLDVKEELKTCQRWGVASEDIFYILLTSVNFQMMRQRLFLFREQMLRQEKAA